MNKTYEEMIDYMARNTVHKADSFDNGTIDRHELASASDEAWGFLLAVSLAYGIGFSTVIADWEDACDFHEVKKQEIWHKD